MPTPARYDLEIYRGDTDAWTFSFWSDPEATEPMDLTGYTAAAHVRVKPGAPEVAGVLVATIELPNLVRVDLPASISESLPVCSSSWDLQLTSASGGVRTVVAGRANVTADVTFSEEG